MTRPDSPEPETNVPTGPMLHVLGIILDKFDVKELRLTTADYIALTGSTEVFYDHDKMEWVIRRKS